MASQRTRRERVKKYLWRLIIDPKGQPKPVRAADLRDISEEILDAAGDPDMMGTAEVAEALGCSAGNLYRQAGLPEPSQKLRAGPIWNAEKIRRFIIERNRRRRARAN